MELTARIYESSNINVHNFAEFNGVEVCERPFFGSIINPPHPASDTQNKLTTARKWQTHPDIAGFYMFHDHMLKPLCLGPYIMSTTMDNTAL